MSIMRIFAPLNSEPLPLLQEIEIATFFQLPNFHIIGLPNPEVAEAKERVRAAIDASGLKFPKKRVVLNLSPASIRKKGTGLDLAMALGILLSEVQSVHLVGAWGELSLDGSVKPAGQLTRSIYAAWKGGLSHLFVSQLELSEAVEAFEMIRETQEFSDLPPQIVPIGSLGEAWKLLSTGHLSEGSRFGASGSSGSDPVTTLNPYSQRQKFPIQNSQIHPTPPSRVRHSDLLPLTPALERIIGVSASGLHHILLLGPRGAGKSHALEWLIALQLPSSSRDQVQRRLSRELNPLHSNEPSSSSPGLVARRVSAQVRPGALVGGATAFAIRPGEFSLAHGGLLVADELPEWARDSREALREPLERGQVTLTRTQGALELPAQFLLAANGNFCPCGGWPPHFPLPPEWTQHPKALQKCRCTRSARSNYLSKLSGPLLDRIDLVALVAPPFQPHQTLKSDENPLSKLQERVQKTRNTLLSKWGKPPGLLTGLEIEKIIQSQSTSHAEQTQSLRARHKIAKLALTLAAWDSLEEPRPSHWLEASYYRPERFLDDS